MKRLGAAVVALSFVAGSANAAELTRIASSFEEDHPFGLYLDLSFQRSSESGKIVREHHQNDNLEDVSELDYSGSRSQLKIDAHVGIWKDLDFHFGLPLVFAQNESWRYAEGTDASNSTVTHNCLRPNGTLTAPGCPATGVGEVPLFPVPGDTFRGGIGNLEFGLAYAFFDQKKDDTKPTWIVGLEYEAPTAERLDPYQATASDNRGKVGDRVHKYTLYTSFSRKMGVADPYFQAHTTIPVNGPQWYSNCDHPDANVLGTPGNCGNGPWTRAETGMDEPTTTGMIFGTEFTPYNKPDLHQRVTVDVRALADYVSGGRYYNELSGLTQRLMKTGEYAQLGGQLGVVASATDYISFKANAGLVYRTEHGLSQETLGQDLNGDGAIDASPGSPELNPNFDFRTDLAGRRFRISENSVFSFDLTVSFNF